MLQQRVAGAHRRAAAPLGGTVDEEAARLGEERLPAVGVRRVGRGDVVDGDGGRHPVGQEVVTGEVDGGGLLPDHRAHDDPGTPQRVGALEELLYVGAGLGRRIDPPDFDAFELHILRRDDLQRGLVRGLAENTAQHLVTPHEMEQGGLQCSAVEAPADLERAADVRGVTDVRRTEVLGDGEVVLLVVGGEGTRIGVLGQPGGACSGHRPFHGVSGRHLHVLDGKLQHGEPS